jgi:hypothetical protein
MKRTQTIQSILIAALVGVFTVSIGASLAAARDDAQTLAGELKCSKCILKEAKECANVLQVEKDGKPVTYEMVDNDVSRKFKGKCCTEAKKVKVTGTVKSEQSKNYLTALKIEPAE